MNNEPIPATEEDADSTPQPLDYGRDAIVDAIIELLEKLRWSEMPNKDELAEALTLLRQAITLLMQYIMKGESNDR